MTLLLGVGFMGFCVFDEEPLFDLTDWNLTHVGLLAIAVFVILFELTLRARAGQFTTKDQATLLAALTFWFGVENYARLVLMVFGVHCLVPLEAELLELVEVHSALGVWLSGEMLPGFLGVLACLVGGHALQLTLGWGRRQLQLGYAGAICGILACSLLATLWDLALAGLSAWQAPTGRAASYLQPRTSLSYDTGWGSHDRFEWHRETTQPFVLRFEDLFCFYLQLLAGVTLLCCLLTWVQLLVDLALAGGGTLSYLQVGVGLLWLEHTLWAFAAGHACLLLVGLRVSCRVPFELG